MRIGVKRFVLVLIFLLNLDILFQASILVFAEENSTYEDDVDISSEEIIESDVTYSDPNASLFKYKKLDNYSVFKKA